MSATNHLRPSSSVLAKRPYFRDGWLIQESLPSEWHILVAAILLNQSKRTPEWDVTLFRLFESWPCASSLAASDGSLEELLKPHGFSNVKAKRLRKMSEQYQEWDRSDPRVLYGCGQYAYDSWRIFVKGHRPLPDEINDGALKKFLARYHHGWRLGQPLPPLFRSRDRTRQTARVRGRVPSLPSGRPVSPRGD